LQNSTCHCVEKIHVSKVKFPNLKKGEQRKHNHMLSQGFNFLKKKELDSKVCDAKPSTWLFLDHVIVMQITSFKVYSNFKFPFSLFICLYIQFFSLFAHFLSLLSQFLLFFLHIFLYVCYLIQCCFFCRMQLII
jgi:hypothetical protein